MKKTFLASRLSGFFFFSLTSTAAESCKWCVNENSATETELAEISKLDEASQLKRVRDSGACVIILDSKRPNPKNTFYWAKIETPKGPLTQVTKLNGLFGKTLCKGEISIASKCDTIALASDSPKSTLLHEWLHLQQIKNDRTWCTTSKKLWTKLPSDSESKLMRDKEWDVHKLLWKKRDSLNLNLEDKLAIAAETIEEANARTPWDGAAKQLLISEKIPTITQGYLMEYQKQLMLNKR